MILYFRYSMYTTLIETPLGKMRAAGEENTLRGLWFVGQKHYPGNGVWPETPDYPLFRKVEKWLASYFAGKNPRLNIELGPLGTKFQQQIWEKLMKVPYGKTTTYDRLCPGCARAVGGAVGRNPISILIPCHRVIGFDGSITGYAGGLNRKKALLELEGIVL